MNIGMASSVGRSAIISESRGRQLLRPPSPLSRMSIVYYITKQVGVMVEVTCQV